MRPREVGNLAGIRALFPELGAFVGYAVTAEIRSERPPDSGRRISPFDWWDFVQSAPEPRIVVMADLDDPPGQGAYWGEVNANIHRALGCVGVITNGSVRDLDEVRASRFQMAAAHVSVSHANIHMIAFGSTVKVGGVWIANGDLLHGDQHGVVKVPFDVVGALPAAAEKIEVGERQIIEACQDPDFSAEALKHLYRDLRPGQY